MIPADKKKLDEIADHLMDSSHVFFRKLSREGGHEGAKKFDPSRMVLRAVLRQGPVRMSDIGRHMGISKPYMTALVDRLISEGLVERVQDPLDRRVVEIRITEAGRNDLKEFTKRVREMIVRNLSSLDSDDISSLLESMTNIRRILSRLDEADDRDCAEEK